MPLVIQGLSRVTLPFPILPGSATITSRNTLPDFTVGGYKVKSDRHAISLYEVFIFQSYKYIISFFYLDHSGFGSIKIQICQDADLSGFAKLLYFLATPLVMCNHMKTGG